ncbi:MAG: hypothetical protein DDT42_00433 [candidate division WS2 bacterium]|uniref:LamG-like jellyroll fold domain-containing protein n=1 Tax=Psychracetigena formicireducens TaxID=2986056 RepID=A0A9E2BHA4_PSYF1|nr:hypothetical protein [Candidatus Psychracetigena formicireducens]
MAAWLAGYTRRRMLTIDRTRIDADLINFPALLRLTSARHNFAAGLANGFDTRITAADGTTLLNYERERHDSGASLAEYKFRVPTVSSAANTVCYFYYRTDPTADGANPTAVWDANTMGRWALSENPAGTAPQMRDSTTNANHGTTHGAMTPAQSVEARIARGLNFDGVNDWVFLPGAVSTPIGNHITVEAWVHSNPLPQASAYRGIVAEIFPTNVNFTLHLNGSNHLLRAGFFDGGWHIIQETTPFPISQWVHVAATYNRHFIRIHRDGIQVAVSADLNRPLPTTLDGWRIGRRHDYANPSDMWNGLIDEVRISNIARSPAWIRASFHSGNDTLLTVGAEETPPPPGVIGIENIGVQDIGSAEPPMDSESVGVQDIGGIGVTEEVGIQDIGGIGVIEEVGVQDRIVSITTTIPALPRFPNIFQDVFPIEWGSTFEGNIITYTGGREQRIIGIPEVRKSIGVRYKILNEINRNTILTFFTSRRGRTETFYWIDPTDEIIERAYIVRFVEDILNIENFALNLWNYNKIDMIETYWRA